MRRKVGLEGRSHEVEDRRKETCGIVDQGAVPNQKNSLIAIEILFKEVMVPHVPRENTAFVFGQIRAIDRARSSRVSGASRSPLQPSSSQRSSTILRIVSA